MTTLADLLTDKKYNPTGIKFKSDSSRKKFWKTNYPELPIVEDDKGQDCVAIDKIKKMVTGKRRATRRERVTDFEEDREAAKKMQTDNENKMNIDSKARTKAGCQSL